MTAASPWCSHPETRLGADTSPPTFLVGIFSFRNSASLHSTFQGAWIFTNPTPWIFVCKRSSRSARAGARAETVLPCGARCRVPGAAARGGLPRPPSPPPPRRWPEGARGFSLRGEEAEGPGGRPQTPKHLRDFQGAQPRAPKAAQTQKRTVHSAAPRPLGLYLGAPLSLSRDEG